MAGYKTASDRKIIPRWRRFGDSLRLGELDSSAEPRNHRIIARDFLTQKIADWRKYRTVAHASDVVGAAITLRREKEVTDAAQFLLRSDQSVSVPARELAQRALSVPASVDFQSIRPGASNRDTVGAQIRTYRQLLRDEPRDPISWVELARQYAALGIAHRADHAMNVAVQLAPHNRFVLRSASRLWIHTGDKDKAFETLNRAGRTEHDPWLLAAEIAVGGVAKRKVKHVRKARHMLVDRHFAPRHLSELASAVATLELASGSRKQSKRLFRQSLETPTENSVAQAVWADTKSQLHLQLMPREWPTAYEAEALAHYEDREWKKSAERCELWQLDQPFSASPAWHGTFTAAVAMRDYAKGASFAEHGLVANPGDFTLRNNLAFCLINQDQLKRAEEELSEIDASNLEPRYAAVLAATNGLLNYRRGNIELGRTMYEEARRVARSERRPNLLALATMYHAIEEIAISAHGCEGLRAEALELMKQSKDAVFRVLERRLTEQRVGQR